MCGISPLSSQSCFLVKTQRSPTKPTATKYFQKIANISTNAGRNRTCIIPFPKHQTISGVWVKRICTGTKSEARPGGRRRTSLLHQHNLSVRDLGDTPGSSSLKGNGRGCKDGVGETYILQPSCRPCRQVLPLVWKACTCSGALSGRA